MSVLDIQFKVGDSWYFAAQRMQDSIDRAHSLIQLVEWDAEELLETSLLNQKGITK